MRDQGARLWLAKYGRTSQKQDASRIILLIGKMRSGKSAARLHLREKHKAVDLTRYLDRSSLYCVHRDNGGLDLFYHLSIEHAAFLPGPRVIDAAFLEDDAYMLDDFLQRKPNVEFWHIKAPGREVDDKHADAIVARYLPRCTTVINNPLGATVGDLRQQVDEAFRR